MKLMKGQRFIYTGTDKITKQIIYSIDEVDRENDKVHIKWYSDDKNKSIHFTISYIQERFKKKDYTLLKQNHFDEDLFKI